MIIELFDDVLSDMIIIIELFDIFDELFEGDLGWYMVISNWYYWWIIWWLF